MGGGCCACLNGARFRTSVVSRNCASARRIASSSGAPPATSSRHRSSRCWASSSTISFSRAGDRRSAARCGRMCDFHSGMFTSRDQPHGFDEQEQFGGPLLPFAVERREVVVSHNALNRLGVRRSD